jgi:hypothetical protein
VDSLRGAPDAGTDEFHGGEIVFRALVIAGCNAPEMLDAIEEAFNLVALAVEDLTGRI